MKLKNTLFVGLALLPYFGTAQAGDHPAPAESAVSFDSFCAHPEQRTPTQTYCERFDLTPLLRANGGAQEAKQGCLDFYGAAVRALDYICAYRNQANDLTTRMAPVIAQQVAGQKSGDDAAKKLAAEAAKMHHDAHLEAQRQRIAVIQAYWKSEQLLQRLGAEGHERVQEEIACSTAPDKNMGQAPGLLLEGLAVHEKAYQGANSKNIANALLGFSELMQKLYGSDLASWRNLGQLSARLGKVGDNFTVPGATAAPEISPHAHSADANVAAVQRYAIDYTADKLVLHGSSYVMSEALHHSSRALPVAGAFAATAIDLLVYRHTSPNELAITGFSAFIGAVLAPSVAFAGPAAAATSVALTWLDKKLSSDLLERYVAWSEPFLTQNPGADSRRVHHGWRLHATQQGLCPQAAPHATIGGQPINR